MANPEHVKVVRQGAAAIAEWRRQNPGVRLDLTEADLFGANLTWAGLAEADFNGANLYGADLRGADLRRAELASANLKGADLTEANLVSSDLRGAILLAVELRAADLTTVRLGWTPISSCDLSQATGLSTVNHVGPSAIAVDTIIASFRGAGNRLTPELEAFFLGAGVPKELLARLPEIVGAVEYFSCFISYGQPDLDFARKLRDDLVARGVSCWLYALDATPGERTWREIRTKQRETDKMVVICSAAALIRPGALKEIEEQIDEDPKKIIPISRDNLWTEFGFHVTRAGRDLKPSLLDKNYADFSDDSRYEGSLQRLLKALRRKAD